MLLFDVLYPAYPESGLIVAQDPIVALAAMLVVNFAVNLALAAILLKLAPKFNFKKRAREAIALTAALTIVIFVAEAMFSVLSVLSYFLSFFAIAGAYFWMFKRLGVKGGRALAYGIIFGILTNPLVGDLVIFSFGLL